MRIGMLAPVSHSYPPAGYGPWERVTHDLTESLVTMGIEVTLFAPADSITEAELVPTVPASLVSAPPETHRELEDGHIGKALSASACASAACVPNASAIRK